MIKKLWANVIVGAMLVFAAQQACAADLLQVYQQALKSDPTFKAAFAAEMSAAETTPQKLSFLLPQISFSGIGNLQGARVKNSPANTAQALGNYYDNKSRSYDLALKLTQTIFNMENWANLASARNSVKAARATYNAAEQDLMSRTSSAYFAVLQAREILRYDQANKEALYQQYLQAYQGYKVGVKTITDVYQARSGYETAIATYISDKNDLENKQEDLRVITGILYKRLAPLKENIPAIVPQPANINLWTETAIKHNWSLVAAYYTALQYHDLIRASEAGHLPTLDFSAEYDNDYQRNFGGRGATRVKGPQASLDLELPIFKGGLVNSEVRQAIANYKDYSAKEEKTYRDVINGTRQAYLGIISGISTIKANKRAVIYNQSALHGMQEGYKIGTQTIVDVLVSLGNLYEAQKSYVNSRYDYITSLISLKQEAGTLSAEDLQHINTWLKPVATNVLPSKYEENSEKYKQPGASMQDIPQVTPQKVALHKQQVIKHIARMSKKKVYVQVGAYSSKAHADKMQRILTRELASAHCSIRLAKHKGKILYHVRLGPMKQDAAFGRVISKLHSLGIMQPEII